MSTVDAPGTDTVPGPDETASELERELWAAIDEVPDPHMPVSIVELGMVYSVQPEGDSVTVEMTYPCMGCPAYDMIQDDVREASRSVDPIENVEIEIVWDPVWSKDMLGPEVREQLGDWGIAV
ncbi:MAG: metal-sulfur cluster assembly factor [Halobacteriales archaeon]